MFERSPEVQETLEKAKGAVKHMLIGASMAGATGATFGAVLAALRNESIKFYAASMGSNFFLLSSTYIAFEEVIADKRGDKKDWITGAAAGTITGGFYAGLVGGQFRGLQGAAAGAAVGAAVIFGREEFHRWRLSKGVQRYEAKYGEAPAVYHPTTAVLVESQGPPRELVFPSLLPQSVKISDEEIERRVIARMDELRKEMQQEEEETTAAENDKNQENKGSAN
ncbi:hypothetical protein F441_14236 [Phytophthora nicotianae CJ01A1]|uniref:Mitochondrial import inner membrane translocase subunit TIM22 n=10 Tax=Phytophthora nicotianae TaxID=4792 RepID=W2PVC1_PHYN3|nr:hypothetical protein PPTG_14425 [Phytophthora nicotianae INRA-310]ETI40195.1 hypothetical protein F443_14356 [Phytophthora nicotianae P1569]ETK80302.1 hypothetical protein L915_13994 [Phytophthora nicotianae]ETO68942.1 hypothetical protein F444_14360 [Phytophthora nicotianae P1976]ETP09989.1 hypothetical protein F441_14236 [Phytophthora nicotianae CJ01A1]ETL33719.1 hypothetical protein L916_13896 [Phytophthora nicotianae]